MRFFWQKDEAVNQAMAKFAKARGNVYAKYPRLYDTMDLCHVSISKVVPTLAVAPRKNGEYDFYWNPEFISELSDVQLEAVIKHELLHIVFKHTTARLPHYDFDVFDPKDAQKKMKADDVVKSRIWNLATDCAINQFLRDEINDPRGKKLDCVFPETFQLPEWLNAEAYYRLMADQFKDAVEKLKDLQKQLIDAHEQWEQDGQDGQQSGQKSGKSKKDNQKKDNVAGHGGATDNDPADGNVEEIDASDIGDGEEEEKDGKGSGKDKDNKGEEGEEKEANDQKVNDIAEDLGIDEFNEQADRAMAGKQQGGTGAGKFGGVGPTAVKMTYGAGVKGTPGWMRKTKHESVHGFDIVIEATRKRPNRRYGNVFPGKKRQDTGNKLLLAVDISGSISLELFKKFTEHVNKFTRFSEFDIVFFNDYLVDEEGRILYSAYEPNTDPRKAIRRFKLNQKQRLGGGTNFEPLMLLWNRVCNQYDGLFIFTDGDASYSTVPKQQRALNWIVYPGGYGDARVGHLKHGNIYNMNNEKYNREMPRVK